MMSFLVQRLVRFSVKFRAAMTIGGLLIFLSGCETVPSRQQAYAACDNNVGICYRNCETYEGTDDYGTCQATCEREASACFEQANNSYNTYNVAASSSLYLTPWIGSYCAWYPDRGFVSRYGSLNRGHLGYANSGYFPGRRYRTGNRYDPYYDDYFERRKRRDQRQQRRRNRDRFDNDRGADGNRDRGERRRPRGDRDRNRRGRDRGQGRGNRDDRATPPPRRKRPPGVRSDGQRPTSPPRRGGRVSPNPRPNGPASTAPTRTPRGGGGRAGATSPANRPTSSRPPSSRPPSSRPPSSSKPPASKPPRSRSRPTSRPRSRPRAGVRPPIIKEP